MRSYATKLLVPLAGIEPALLAELDFESSASTNSATGAFGYRPGRPASRSGRNIAGGDCRSTRELWFAPGRRMAKHRGVNALASTAPPARDTTLEYAGYDAWMGDQRDDSRHRNHIGRAQ